jgi:hypothetical protein
VRYPGALVNINSTAYNICSWLLCPSPTACSSHHNLVDRGCHHQASFSSVLMQRLSQDRGIGVSVYAACTPKVGCLAMPSFEWETKPTIITTKVWEFWWITRVPWNSGGLGLSSGLTVGAATCHAEWEAPAKWDHHHSSSHGPPDRKPVFFKGPVIPHLLLMEGAGSFPCDYMPCARLFMSNLYDADLCLFQFVRFTHPCRDSLQKRI